MLEIPAYTKKTLHLHGEPVKLLCFGKDPLGSLGFIQLFD